MSDVRLNRCMELLVEKNHEIVRLTEELADYKRCSLEWGKQMNEHMDEIARLTAEVDGMRPVVEAARGARDAYFTDEATDMAAILHRAIVFLSKQLRALDGEP